MRALIVLASSLVSAAALGQTRQYGDSYAGQQETIRQLVLHNQLQANRNNFSAPAYRVEQQLWRPSAASYSPSNYSPSRDSRSGQQATVFYEPEPYLVPFGNPGSWRPPSSGQSDDIWDLYLNSGGDPARAVAMAGAPAQAGDTMAMLLLALAHQQGRGLPADEAKSLSWLQRAADAGEPHAALYYARALIGTGRAEGDYGVALRYFEKAEPTLPEAGLEIGLILAKGRPGVGADPPRGVAYFERSARGGNAFGQYLYAISLLYGAGVAKDQLAAIPWLRKASDQGLAMAQLRLGEAYYFGDGVPVDYARALPLFESAAAQDEVAAFTALGSFYGDGLAVPVDAARAVAYFRKGAERGDPSAQLGLASAYFTGKGVVQDDREGMRWATLASDQGSAAAKYVVGYNLLRGIGVERDVASGIRRLQQSAAGGFTMALDQLCDETTRTHGAVRVDSPDFTPTLEAGLAKDQRACLYVQSWRLYKGLLGPVDQKRAFDLLARSAEAGYHMAELDYGRTFLALVGQVDASNDANLTATARHWISRAAGHGNVAAANLMEEQGWR